jgi:hypothetical protein
MEFPRSQYHDNKIKLKVKKQNRFFKFLCFIANAFLFLIPPYFKKKKSQPQPQQIHQGLPYVVYVENKTKGVLKDVVLLGAYDTLDKKVFNDKGNLSNKLIEISSAIPEVSYKDILFGFTERSFKVGLTYIMSTNEKQLFSTLKLTSKKISGELQEEPLIGTKDPYQQQTKIIALKKDYVIDGFSKIVISNLEPESKVSYYFYPVPYIAETPKNNNILVRFFRFISKPFKKKELPKFGLSKPIVIEVTNHSEELLTDVSVFGSYKDNCFDTQNNFVSDNVTIKSLTPNISYAETLRYIALNPFKVDLNYIRVSDGDSNQIFSDLKIRTKSPNGCVAQKTIRPSIDPYQNQSDVLALEQKFTLDGFTEMIISELKPKTSVVHQLYTSVRID